METTFEILLVAPTLKPCSLGDGSLIHSLYAVPAELEPRLLALGWLICLVARERPIDDLWAGPF